MSDPLFRETDLLDRSTLMGLALIAALILSLSLHEAAHALVAHWRGDDGPKERGRITINPLKHIHPVLTVALPLFLWFGLPWLSTQIAAMPRVPPMLFGGARPVMVDRNRFRHPHRDMMWVALAGPVTNLLIALAALFLFEGLRIGAGVHSSQFGMELLLGTVKWNLFLAAFNLLPIPPLDGSRVLAWLLPPPIRPAFGALDIIGLPLVLGIVFFVPGVYGWLEGQMWYAYSGMSQFVRGTYELVGLRR